MPGVLLYALAIFVLFSQFARIWLVNCDEFLLGAIASSAVFFFFLTLWIGNLARVDVWVWYAAWSRVALAARGSPAARS